MTAGAHPSTAPAPTERGWLKLILALTAFLLLPSLPWLRSFLPVERTTLLFVPALAACSLVGWWAGGRAFMALAWVALAALLAAQPAPPGDAFWNLARGWSLLLGGSFGLVCLFGPRRPFLARALFALTIALLLAVIMSSLGPVNATQAAHALSLEFQRRNAEVMDQLNGFIGSHPKEWQQLTTTSPQFAGLPAQIQEELGKLSRAALAVYPALLALESLAGLGLAWATYHRLSRTRLGAPLAALRDFRFNDQLVWGLIVGLTIVFLPTLTLFRGLGRNLLVFFGALYALRGLGVLAWFLAPGALVASVTVGFAMFLFPVLNFVAAFGFTLLIIAAFGLGLGDTWADWRRRARPTS